MKKKETKEKQKNRVIIKDLKFYFSRTFLPFSYTKKREKK